MSIDRFTPEEIDDAREQLYQVRCVADLLRNLGQECEEIETTRLNDLGRLIDRLTDRPLSVLVELAGDRPAS